MSEKREKIVAKSKKLNEDAMVCNTLWSDRRRLLTKTFLTFWHTFSRTSSELIQTFHKKVFCFFALG